MHARVAAFVMAALTLGTALLGPAAAQAQVPGYGSVIGTLPATSIFYLHTNGGPSLFAFKDGDNDNSLDPNEAVYASVSSTLGVTDVRLANPPVGSVGSRIAAGDSDAGLANVLGGSLRFVDLDGSSKFSTADLLVYDLSASGSGTLTINDVILSGAEAGHLVTGTTIGLSVAMGFFNGGLGYADTDNDNAFDTGEALMIDSDRDGYVGPMDVRLGQTAGGAFGSTVRKGAADMTYVLVDDAAPTRFMYLDSDASSTLGNTERTFLGRQSSTRSDAFSVRLSDPLVGTSGSLILDGDADAYLTTLTLSGTVGYVGTAPFASTSTLYYDVSGAGSGTVSLGDIVLSGTDAGKRVVGGMPNIGSGFSSWAGVLRYFDDDGNRVFNSGDILFGDTNSNRIADTNDVQFSRDQPPGPVVPPTITIDAPVEAACVAVGAAFTISGTAVAGTNSLGSVSLTVGGATVPVNGVATWSASHTPAAAGALAIVASANPNSGAAVTASRQVTAAESCAPVVEEPQTKECPDGSVIAAEDECPGFDPEARDAAEEAREIAEEARDSAQEAAETADRAADAAEGAREAAESTQDAVQALVDRLDANESSADEEGVPSVGSALVLLLIAALALAIGRSPPDRRRRS